MHISLLKSHINTHNCTYISSVHQQWRKMTWHFFCEAFIFIIIIIWSLSATQPFPRVSAKLFCSAEHAVELSPDAD